MFSVKLTKGRRLHTGFQFDVHIYLNPWGHLVLRAASYMPQHWSCDDEKLTLYGPKSLFFTSRRYSLALPSSLMSVALRRRISYTRLACFYKRREEKQYCENECLMFISCIVNINRLAVKSHVLFRQQHKHGQSGEASWLSNETSRLTLETTIWINTQIIHK